MAYTGLFAGVAAAISYDYRIRSFETPIFSEAEQKAALRREKGITTTRVVAMPNPNKPQEVVTPTTGKATQLPRGVFLIKETLSLKSTDGEPLELGTGTEVILLRHEAGKLKVSQDGRQFLIEESQVTRNAHTIEKLLAARRSK